MYISNIVGSSNFSNQRLVCRNDDMVQVRDGLLAKKVAEIKESAKKVDTKITPVATRSRSRFDVRI